MLILSLITACGVLPLSGRDAKPSHLQNTSIELATNDLARLEQIDSVIRLNNRWLSKQIKDGIYSAAKDQQTYDIQKLKISFQKQYISIDASIGVSDMDKNVIDVNTSGRVELDFNPTYVNWIPHFDELQVTSSDFSFNGANYTESDPNLADEIKQELNKTLSLALLGSRKSMILLNAVPLAEIEVGASLPEFNEKAARHTESLNGTFITAGSATLIEPSQTTAALDLTFLPNVSICPVDIKVSRAEFARDIESREPIDIVKNEQRSTEIKYFFSEISGANRPYTIVHYWYANGKPVALEELAVAASKRWRTWSSAGTSHSSGDRLEVLVVEKDSGCILLSRAIKVAEKPDSPPTGSKIGSFTQLKKEFDRRLTGFSIQEDKPEIIDIETRGSLIAGALGESLQDLSILAGFETDGMKQVALSADLMPFETTDIICEKRSCPPIQTCKTNITHCKRFRDTRDCTSCLFRNPLNNRCVKEAVDPLCEAARNRQNSRYEDERIQCIANAEASKQECDQLNAQADSSCRIEAGFAESACDDIKQSISKLDTGAALAKIESKVKPNGFLGAEFSNFRIEGNLERLKLDVALLSDMQMRGTIRFLPGNIAAPLASCIAEWNAPFESRIGNTPVVNDLQSVLQHGESELVANWSGFGMKIVSSPSPVESLLVGNPDLLANCKIGLTVNKVEKAIAGDKADFYRGHYNLEIQPLPTVIKLESAVLELGESQLEAKPQITGDFVRYEFAD